MLIHPEETEDRSDLWLVLRVNGSMALAYLLAVYGPRLFLVSFSARLALGALALVVFGLVVIAELRGLRRADELQKRVRIEALATAYPWSLLLIIAVAVFQRLFDVPTDWTYRALFLLLPFPYYIALKVARRRYQ